MTSVEHDALPSPDRLVGEPPRHVRPHRVDRGLLFLNLGLLAGIAFLPFPTAFLARYIRDSDNAATAAVVYGMTMVAIGLFFTALLAYPRRHPELLKPWVTAEGVRRAGRLTAIAVFFAIGSGRRIPADSGVA